MRSRHDEAGQPRSFPDVHAFYHPRIVRYLGQLVGRQEAEDVAQEVFLRVSRRLADFRGESSLGAWIFRIARHAGLDRLRQRLARSEGARDPGPSFLAGADEPGPAPDERPSAERQLIGEEMRACIRGRVERLPGPYRAVLLLSEAAGLSDAEIASQLGTSLGNVKIRLHRARTRLRQDLAGHCTLYRDERDELACDPRGTPPQR